MENKKIKKTEEKETVSCSDKLCPVHGSIPLKVRGRTFEGEVIKKLPGRITIRFERFFYIPKYERYEKRNTKIHARLPDCMKEKINLGDYIEIGECRPVSKIIHCVVIKKIRSKFNEEKSK